jgi:exosortase E/protease (VPEID-CTERM system)
MSVWFHSFLSPITPDITFDHRGIPVLSDASFAISLNPPCAGYQGMFTSLALLLSYVLFFHRNLHLARSLALVSAAIGAVFMMNSVRIAVLFEIGVRYSPEIAVEGFHSNFGTLSVFLVVAAAMVTLNMAFFRKTALAEGPIAPAGSAVYPTNERGSFKIPPDTLWQMVPLALMLVTMLVAGLFVGTFNWLYPVPIVVGTIATAYLWPRIRTTFAETVTWHSIAMGVLIYVIWIAMIPRDLERAEMIMESLQQAPVWAVLAWIFFRVVGSGIIVPILEELAFRGGVMGLCKEGFGLYLPQKATVALALIVSSVAFGLMHSTVLAAAIAGLGYGLIALHRNKIGDAIIAHAVTNLLIAGHVLVLFDWSLW